MGFFADDRRSFLILSILSVLKFVSGDGMLELQLVSFSNTRGVLIDGTQCDHDGTQCDVWMDFCLTRLPYQANSSCTYGNESTTVLGGNNIDFVSGQSLGNDLTNPISFPFSEEWPSQFGLFIQVLDEDIGGDELVDRYSQAVQVEPGTSQQSAIWKSLQMTGDGLFTTIAAQVKVYCAENWYDRHCNTYCYEGATYTCEYSTGSKLCKLGWEGLECIIPACTTGCHPRHGSCTQPRECICEEHWTGRLCDECIPKDGCGHGICINGNDCHCNDDTWTGELCTIDLDSCRSSPCKNGASCDNAGPDSYSCNCAPGFTGDNCQIDIDECESSPCQNNGDCTDGQGFYECQCDTGYLGDNCEIEIDHCARIPAGVCGDYGTCVSRPTGSVCVCEEGFTGDTCNINVDDCVNHECKHDGVCVDKIRSYECDCKPGWEGHHCHREIDECSSSPCKHEGTCTDLVADFSCVCPRGWEGKDCTARAPEDCYLEDKGTISHGAKWGDDCNGCYCEDGVVKCSKIWCGPDNCLDLNSDIDKHDDVIVTCPPEAPCTLVSEYECLQGECMEFGKCINENEPSLQDARCGASFFDDKAATYACSYVGMRLDYNILPLNTTVEDVCYELRRIQDLWQHAMDDQLVILCDKDIESGQDNVIYVSQESAGGIDVTAEAMDEMISYIMSLPDESDNLILKSIYDIFVPKNSAEGHTGSSTGIWLPILLALLFLLLLIAVIVFIIWYRRRKRREDKHVDHPLSRLTLKMRENPFFEEKEEVEDYNCTTYVDKCSSADADYELDVISLSSQSDNGDAVVEVSEADADYVAMGDNAGEWQGPQPETFSGEGSPDMV